MDYLLQGSWQQVSYMQLDINAVHSFDDAMVAVVQLQLSYIQSIHLEARGMTDTLKFMELKSNKPFLFVFGGQKIKLCLSAIPSCLSSAMSFIFHTMAFLLPFNLVFPFLQIICIPLNVHWDWNTHLSFLNQQ